MAARDVRYNVAASTTTRSGAADSTRMGASTRGASTSRSKATRSLRETYVDGCKDASVHPISSIVAMLPDKHGVALPSDVLDMSRCFVGDKGVGPLLIVVQKSIHLRALILSENGLRNNAIKMIASVAAHHPSLRSIDVSDNYISEGAGTALLQLADENTNIVEIRMANTKIPAESRVRINDRLAGNRQVAPPL